jgi:uncharacterized protein YqgQ
MRYDLQGLLVRRTEVLGFNRVCYLKTHRLQIKWIRIDLTKICQQKFLQKL